MIVGQSLASRLVDTESGGHHGKILHVQDCRKNYEFLILLCFKLLFDCFCLYDYFCLLAHLGQLNGISRALRKFSKKILNRVRSEVS
jgi:hypothetical protein